MTYINQSPKQKAARKKQSENWRKQMRRFDNQRLFPDTDLTKQPNVVREMVNEPHLDQDDQDIVEEMRSKISSD